MKRKGGSDEFNGPFLHCFSGQQLPFEGAVRGWRSSTDPTIVYA